MTNQIDFLGFPVSNLTGGQLLEVMGHHISNRSKCQVVPLNANKLWLATRDRRLRRILRDAEIVIPEYAIVWGSRVLGMPLQQHMGGIMFMRQLLAAAPGKEYRVYFLGAEEDVVRKMVERMHTEFPGLTIAGWHNGYFNTDSEVIKDVNESCADILLVAMGTPKQEYFIRDNLERIDVPVMMGVGGSFDVFSGHRKECPPFLRHGFEWVYRMMQDPIKLGKRYLRTNTWFVYQVLKGRMMKTTGRSLSLGA
jgi:N-acetylglucosaminyldiphosphoundecaprenol N-acetyl-beta-D-mannosaminyltransferase